MLVARAGGGGEGWTEWWEPFRLEGAHSAAAGVEYVAALLAQMGPLWVGDWRLQTAIAAVPSLAQLPTRDFLALAADFGIFVAQDSLYNLALPAHRLLFAALLNPSPAS